MITLHQFAPAWGLPNLSPFCFKLETYLRMANLPYTAKTSNPRASPKGKLPSIDDGGTIVCDSGAIVEHLKKKHGDPLDGALSIQQRALGHAIRRMCEESLYWPLVFSRWGEDDAFELVRRDLLRPALPPVLRVLLPGVIRKQVLKQLHGQGMGRHSRDEIYEIGKNDITALSTLLGAQPYFLGDAPTSVDATTYAWLALVLWAPPGSPLTTHAKGLDNIVQYCERMRDRYWSDKAKAA
jgi:glutathione S-transferase